MRGKVVVLLAAVFTSAGAGAGGDAKTELKKFAGTWSFVSIQKDGKDELPEEVRNTLRLTFAGDKLTFADAKETRNGTFKIDPTKKPKQIDLMVDDKTVKGIYRFKGDTLELCAGEPGEARPGEFKAPVGNRKISLVVLKRANN